MAQSKTTVRRAQPNPVFKEPFYFQVRTLSMSIVTGLLQEAKNILFLFK